MPPTVRSFGEFELDAACYELRRRGRVLKLERIPMELLLLLSERDGQVVGRPEIIERLWGKDVFVDTEHGINTAIRKIRAALREDGERPRHILTVPGRGYRFLAREPNGDGAAAATVEVPPVPEPGAPPERRLWPWAAGVAALCLLASSLVWLDLGGIRERLLGAPRPGPIRSIAVLPLVNLSGDPSQDYFADGITDELITALAKNSSLRVVSRTSAMQYKGVHRPLREIAGELGVDGVLEGSLVRSGTRLHMTVQLVRGPSDSNVWAESYDRDLGDAFSLAVELSQAIAKAVDLAAAPAAPERRVDPQAHDAYLRGRFLWFNDDYARSQELFEKAIQLQPDYAMAWSGLADAYTVRAVAVELPPQEVIPRARAAAQRAVQLDDTLADAHKSLAAVLLFGDWDGRGADAECLRARALAPNDAETGHLRSYVLQALGRSAEALEEQRRASELDPFARPWALGYALIHARQFDAAIDDLRLRAEAQPSNDVTRAILSDAYWYMGMWKESAQELEKAFHSAGAGELADGLRQAFASGGGPGVARWRLEGVESRARRGYVSPWSRALAWARLGRREETLRFLEEALDEHSAQMVFLQNEPLFDFLHAEARYRDVVKRTGFPPTY